MGLTLEQRTLSDAAHRLAANPCPCAPADPKDCICAAMAKRRYRGKLSGPLLDRVDLRVQMHTERLVGPMRGLLIDG